MHLTSVTATDETPIKLKLERFEVPPPQKESGTQRYPARDALTRNGRIMMCGGAVFMYCLEKRTTGSRGTADSIKLIAKKNRCRQTLWWFRGLHTGNTLLHRRASGKLLVKGSCRVGPESLSRSRIVCGGRCPRGSKTQPEEPRSTSSLLRPP